jgi:hypothetical protein
MLIIHRFLAADYGGLVLKRNDKNGKSTVIKLIPVCCVDDKPIEQVFHYF